MMRKLMYVREHIVEALLVKLCTAKDWLCMKFVSPGMRGVPDRMVLKGVHRMRKLLPPECIFWSDRDLAILLAECIEFIEVKAPGEKPTPQQERRHEELRALGFTVTVLDSQDAVREWADRA